MSRLSRRWHVGAACGMTGALLGFGLASCENIVGFDGSTYASVVDTMCSCPEMLQAFASTASCKTYVEAGLNRGSAGDDQKWLATFHQRECDLCTPTDISSKLPCIEAPPLCLENGEPCDDPAECCGYSAQTAECIHVSATGAGACGACKKLGDTCATSDECCGNHKGSFDVPYCSSTTHTCVERQHNCIKSGEPCASDDECCGFEGGSGSCKTGTLARVCVESCAPDAPDNCPGCCAAIPGGTGECRDRAPASCSSYCNPNAPNTGCAAGLTCREACFALNCTYVCAA